MRDLLNFLGRGFALFAGGPPTISQYPTLSGGGAVATVQRLVRGL